MNVFTLIQASGVIGYTIILLSFVAVALIIEYAVQIRRSILSPPALGGELRQLLAQGQLAPALEKCRNDKSVLSQILLAALLQCEFGWAAVEKAGEEEAAKQASKLYRRAEYLSVIGNIAPMLGLLGTVVGMVFAFEQLASAEGYVRAADFAQGIYLALVTTVEGLLVAIPSLTAYSFFNNRIAALMTETLTAADTVLAVVRKGLRASLKTAETRK
ncbi:MAG: MotA/TolQ/ExbB proton channel family protein [Planctomycetaceae bacterium]|jgi:biopolymer transport protein ExbB|nr:MotA/TolQ/ExbB proton channel family protein [Planctomycetaceae bacterium]